MCSRCNRNPAGKMSIWVSPPKLTPSFHVIFSPQDYEEQAFQCFTSVLKIDPDHKKAKAIRRVR